MVDPKEARQKEWNEQFGDHTECSVCGTACEMLFVEEAEPVLPELRSKLIEENEAVEREIVERDKWAKRAEAAEAERDLFKRRLATSEECRDILHAENEKLRELLHHSPKMIHRHDMLNQPIDCAACKWIKERDEALSPIPAQPQTVPTSNCIGTPVVTVSKGAPPGVGAPSWAEDIKADIKADMLLEVYSGGDVSSVYVNWFRWQRLADWLNEEWRNGGRSDVQG